MVEFTVIFKKQKYQVKFALDETVDALKNHIEKLTGSYFNSDGGVAVATVISHWQCEMEW